MNVLIYNKLKEIAQRQETISYSQLASDCDSSYNTVDERNKFHDEIGEISEFEVKNSRPMLSVLVCHKGDIERTPGLGFFHLADKLNQRLVDETDKEMQYRIIKDCWNFWRKNNVR